RTALVCPDAFDAASARAVLEVIDDPIVLSVDDAMTFCANSVVIGRHVVMPECPAHIRTAIESAGFEVVLVEMDEFHKGGGSIRCMTNPLDIVVGRDLRAVPGGEVVLP
ncbi:MAG TPA: amidinotransferase, partial [Nocardioidaceae bacterium]|nr:amidinotransferase [Nocardioidaceae bacterium]